MLDLHRSHRYLPEVTVLGVNMPAAPRRKWPPCGHWTALPDVFFFHSLIIENSPKFTKNHANVVEHEAKRGNITRSHKVIMFSRCKMSAAPHELSSDNVPQLYCAILGSDDPFSDWWNLWQSKVLSDVGHLCKKAMPDSEPGTTMPRTSISPDLNQCHSFQCALYEATCPWEWCSFDSGAAFLYMFPSLGNPPEGEQKTLRTRLEKKISKGPAAPMSPISLSHIYTQSSWPSLEAWL